MADPGRAARRREDSVRRVLPWQNLHVGRTYSMTVIKALFATSCNACAFEGCEEQLTDPVWNQVKADIAHIRGENPTAARFDPAMIAADRNAFDNLMLLCPNCHRRIDRLEPDNYPPGRLMEMKRRHEERCSERWASDERLDQFTELLIAAVEPESSTIQSTPPPRLSVEFGGDDSVFVVNVGDTDAYAIRVLPSEVSSESWVPVGDPPARLSPGGRYRAGVTAKSLDSSGPFVLRLEWSDQTGGTYDGEFPY